MRKLVITLVAFFATATMAFGNAVLVPKALDNTYIGVDVGATGWVKPNENGFDNFWKSLKPDAGLRIGKWITPCFGAELNGEVGFGHFTTLVDHTNVTFNTLFNLNNILHGYKGKADVVEVAPFTGIGWYHTYGDVTNSLSWRGGVSVDWNLGKTRAWQLNFRPTINYILATEGATYLGYDIRRAYVGLSVGVTYRFKTSNGAHNFALCNKRYTQAEWDDVNAELASIRRNCEASARRIAELEEALNAALSAPRETAKVATVVVEGTKITPVVGFNIGSAVVSETQVANIVNFANAVKDTDDKITVVGYADVNTGSAIRNQSLSEARADAVVDILVANGVARDRLTIIGRGASVQPFAKNNLNRAVMLIVD